MNEEHPSEWTPLERIRFLLDQWDAIFDGRASRAGRSSSDAPLGIDLLPPMANHPSIIELSRCLKQLDLAHPSWHKHLKAYRVGCEWRQVRAKVRVKLSSGRWDWIPGWRTERIVPEWVNARYVFDGEEFLVREFRGDVFIPKDLWDGLTKAVEG